MKRIAVLLAVLMAASIYGGQPPALVTPLGDGRYQIIGTDTLILQAQGLKYHKFYNVANYGADQDSTTDDLAALKSAIDAYRNDGDKHGATIYFPPGIYYLSDSIEIPVDTLPGVRIVGDAWGTRIKVAGSHGLVFYDTSAANKTNVAIENIKLEGVGVNVQKMIECRTMSYLFMANVDINGNNYATGIDLWGTQQGVILGGRINQCDSGIVLTSSNSASGWLNPNGITIIGVTMTMGSAAGNPTCGVYYNGSHTGTLLGNHITNCTTFVQVDSGHGIVIRDNHFETGDSGVVINGGSNHVIDGNKFYSGDVCDLYLKDGHSSSITNNLFNSEVFIGTNSTGNKIESNLFSTDLHDSLETPFSNLNMYGYNRTQGWDDSLNMRKFRHVSGTDSSDFEAIAGGAMLASFIGATDSAFIKIWSAAGSNAPYGIKFGNPVHAQIEGNTQTGEGIKFRIGSTEQFQIASGAIRAKEVGTFSINEPSDSGYYLPTTDGTSGYVLKTDGAGSVSWSADNTGGSGYWGQTDSTIAYSSTDTVLSIRPDDDTTYIESENSVIKIDTAAKLIVGEFVSLMAGLTEIDSGVVYQELYHGSTASADSAYVTKAYVDGSAGGTEDTFYVLDSTVFPDVGWYVTGDTLPFDTTQGLALQDTNTYSLSLLLSADTAIEDSLNSYLLKTDTTGFMQNTGDTVTGTYNFSGGELTDIDRIETDTVTNSYSGGTLIVGPTTSGKHLQLQGETAAGGGGLQIYNNGVLRWDFYNQYMDGANSATITDFTITNATIGATNTVTGLDSTSFANATIGWEDIDTAGENISHLGQTISDAEVDDNITVSGYSTTSHAHEATYINEDNVDDLFGQPFDRNYFDTTGANDSIKAVMADSALAIDTTATGFQTYVTNNGGIALSDVNTYIDTTTLDTIRHALIADTARFTDNQSNDYRSGFMTVGSLELLNWARKINIEQVHGYVEDTALRLVVSNEAISVAADSFKLMHTSVAYRAGGFPSNGRDIQNKLYVCGTPLTSVGSGTEDPCLYAYNEFLGVYEDSFLIDTSIAATYDTVRNSNPVIEQSDFPAGYGHLSDPFINFGKDGDLYMLVRVLDDNSTYAIYAIHSPDGVTWSDTNRLIDGGYGGISEDDGTIGLQAPSFIVTDGGDYLIFAEADTNGGTAGTAIGLWKTGDLMDGLASIGDAPDTVAFGAAYEVSVALVDWDYANHYHTLVMQVAPDVVLGMTQKGSTSGQGDSALIFISTDGGVTFDDFGVAFRDWYATANDSFDVYTTHGYPFIEDDGRYGVKLFISGRYDSAATVSERWETRHGYMYFGSGDYETAKIGATSPGSINDTLQLFWCDTLEYPNGVIIQDIALDLNHDTTYSMRVLIADSSLSVVDTLCVLSTSSERRDNKFQNAMERASIDLPPDYYILLDVPVTATDQMTVRMLYYARHKD